MLYVHILPAITQLITLASHVRCSSAQVQIDSQVLTVPDSNHPPHLLVNISTFLPRPWAQPSWLYSSNLSCTPPPTKFSQMSPWLPLSQSDSILLPLSFFMICSPQAAQNKSPPPQWNHGHYIHPELPGCPGILENKWIQQMMCTSRFAAIRPSSDVHQPHSKSFYSLISILICHCWQ